MKVVAILIALMIAFFAAVPASACENRMTGVTVTTNAGRQIITWTYQNECQTQCLFKVEARCCDGGTWATLVDDFAGSTYKWLPGADCDSGWQYRVTMVQGCTQYVCYVETVCQ